MAEKPKNRRPETRTQKTDIEKKVPKAAAERAAPPVPSGKAPPKTNQAISPKKPETARHVTAEERWNRIAKAAYYRAEKRGFVGGDPAEDWSAAEIDAQLAGRKQ